jgi:hypothetical protein
VHLAASRRVTVTGGEHEGDVATAQVGGPQGDELARCLAQSTSEDDKAVLAQWLFISMALHPKVSQLASVPEERRTQATKDLAALIQKIFTRTCREEARVAYKNEGNDAITMPLACSAKWHSNRSSRIPRSPKT